MKDNKVLAALVGIVVFLVVFLVVASLVNWLLT